MAELQARSEQSGHWWARPLEEGRTYTLGRAPGEVDLVVSWDPYVSRIHASLHWKGGRLWVRKHPQAKNPIFVQGRAADEFTIEGGGRFVIGCTVFELVTGDHSAASDATPDVAEFIYPLEGGLPAAQAERYARALLEKLPDLLGSAASVEELQRRTLEVVLAGLPHAQWAALVKAAGSSESPSCELLAWMDRQRPAATPQISRRLVWRSIRRERKNVLHLRGRPAEAAPEEYTVPTYLDWAICVPLVHAPEPDLGLYVAGQLAHPLSTGSADQLQSEVRYVELVARIHSHLRRTLYLQRQQSVLAHFFPRPILALFSHPADLEEVLRPREVEVTVLFCDLRGSSRFADQWEHDLLGLWQRIGDALSIISACIADFGGVLGDLHGDAAMGFWGWPLEDQQGAQKAAQAALAIVRRFERLSLQPEHPLRGFRCGIGIATGRAVAGRLGTPEQFKVTVYGPPVNLAARLEALTKPLGATVLVDQATARRLIPQPTWGLVRRLGRIRPRGMDRQVELYELLAAEEVSRRLSEGHHVQDLEAAVSLLEQRRWQDAAKILRQLPRDPVAEKLHHWLRSLGYNPPRDWDGTLPLSE